MDWCLIGPLPGSCLYSSHGYAAVRSLARRTNIGGGPPMTITEHISFFEEGLVFTVLQKMRLAKSGGQYSHISR